MDNALNILISTWIKLFFVLAPFFVLTMFLALTRSFTPQQQRRTAVKVTVAVYVICMCLYFFGDTIFAIFGITLDAFRIGAGALLFLSAVSLVRGPQPAQEPLAEGDISVVPLAIPITVGPATTGALMVMGATVRTPMERVMGSVSLLAAVLTVGGLLYLANPIERMLGRIGISILTKLTGLILAALAAQIIFTGIRNFLG
ncbi:MarC family protein [Nitratidesulfovibrio vulgaris]|jgi:multiple antibiotic resistance protein|uniref:UPF0056 inner membrane protein n=2 Tax=Nitratidesulfovibrio vulgaris TaxID=881 RepID=Q72B53_NITV2|nr:MarC family protein [Nitratidesulfovibrio vulgaris]GEB79446.1 UPF0056 inner membrane protein [Desulfovibrio desulfuricans]HBW15388.1 hypothetical protein [Desulfovibrio sp.]AAS96262.1 membrane protein, MarC family [Nitratidesulfovibrio vulgaris str. Hildenborough]ABM28391.1 multiple antibiotic resistance (MarC)-related protein [Nitratidesulfovibrio vulgaris DP4]ADP86671.1 multiple antibiotic resistance (MarC)-related protein [Nitratidesulfovibrio vulgaris RCH1]